MFENIAISSLSVIGIGIIVLSLVRYRITRNEAEGFILFGIGFALLGFSLVVYHLMMDDIGTKFLSTGTVSIIVAVLSGLIGAHRLGTGNPRTFLLANQEIRIIGSAVSKYKRVKFENRTKK